MGAHKSEVEIQADIAAAEKGIVIGGIYSHYSDPAKIYKVLDIITSEEKCAPEVVYEAQYGASLKFGRLVSSWLEMVEFGGEEVPRFSLVEAPADELGGDQANG